MNLHYWQYFLALESDLAKTFRFVEPTQSNFTCHSIEFSRILLAAGSEIDVLCKVLCEIHSMAFSNENMDCYRKVISTHFHGFTKLEILLPRHGLRRLPWKAWEENKNPEWWKAYNKVKHERNKNFTKANFENTLDSMAALFVLVSYICERELRERRATPWPQMLTLDPQLSSDIRTNLRPGHVIPDFKT